MGRGQLRIYLGAAPGVGKTVAMLSEGLRRRDRGADVVVGVVETHGRPYTATMLTGFEIVPRAERRHRTARLTEMDLDAVLRRHPDVVLVDELAHTNAPGSTHEKRWEDVRDLLDAGIDVISTVNIQHLESLNDACRSITGVVQQETVPDTVVQAADQIELVDMSPEALRRRMAHGNVYAPTKVDAALANYFRVGNLAALRQLALLWLADRVDEGIATYRDQHSIDGLWPIRERVLVAINGDAESPTLLRRAARIASRGAGGELVAGYVARGDGLAGPSIDKVAAARRLTEELGGTFQAVTGDDRAAAILALARAEHATTIVLGASRRSRWRHIVSPSTVTEVIKGAGDIDVHVVTHPYAGGAERRRVSLALPLLRVEQGFAVGLLGTAALTAALRFTHQPVGLPLIVQLYLVLTIAAALVGGLAPALTTAVVSSLAVNWFFTPPIGTLTIASPQSTAALALYVIVAAAVSFVVHRSSRRAATALAAQGEATAMAELSTTLLGSVDQLPLLLHRAVRMFDVNAAAIVRGAADGRPHEIVAATEDFDLRTGASTKAVIDDDHDLILTGGPVAADRRKLLAAFAAQASAVMTRRQLRSAQQAADVLERDNRARTALLSAVSHDLRTPLTGIKAAIGSLRSTEVHFTPEDRAELEAAIESSADRLEALIGNLLDMSRLQAGALVTHLREVDLAEIMPAALSNLDEPDRVDLRIVGDARVVIADAGLLERVLGNLVDNAERHQRAETPVRVSSSRLHDRVEVRVIDHGRGIDGAERDQMFRPFQRKADHGVDGVGLGLAVARGLTEAMNGTLSAEDTPGGGLTMVVALPAPDTPESTHP